ncbi:MAG: phage minor capsid protein [Candidatus Onthovivens sp.]|nr:phage minor capsid protein [Candidatus Onthovivens sp.]
MIDEKFQEQLLEVFDKRFQDYNTKVLEELGNVIKQFKDLTPSQAYSLAQQLKYNTTVKDLLNELSKISGLSVKDLKAILEKVAKENIGFADVYYKSRGLETPIYSKNKALQRLVYSVYSISGAEFKNIAKSTGFRLLGDNGEPLLLDIGETYNEVIDRCVVAISQGKETYQQSMRSTLKQLSDSGVRKIDYANNYSRRIDSSVRMNVLDAVREVSNQSQMLFGEEFDYNAVEVSHHNNSAPDHSNNDIENGKFDIDGHQFVKLNILKEQIKNGMEKEITLKDIDEVNHRVKCKGKWYYDFDYINNNLNRPVSTMSCYHYIFSIVLGVSRPQFTDKQLEEDKKKNNDGFEFDGKRYTFYEGEQLLNRIALEIRKNKDTQIMAKSSGDDDLILSSQTKITQLTTKYRQVVKVSGLPNKLAAKGWVPGYKRTSVKNLKK